MSEKYSVEDVVKMLGDSIAVSRAQSEQDVAQKYEEDPEWEEKEAQAEDERRLADDLRISAIIRADLEQVRKIMRMKQQIEDARDRLKATDDPEKQAACRSEIESLTPELKELRVAARQGRRPPN
jgi:hypothetical protein